MTSVRALLVDDAAATETESQVASELRLAGIEVRLRRVTSESEFVAHLRPAPDVILWAGCAGTFDADRALRMMRERALDLPFLMIGCTADADREPAPDGATRVRSGPLGGLGPALVFALAGRDHSSWPPLTREQQGFNESLFRALVDRSLVGIYVIQDGRFTYANPRLAELFGYSVEEVLALNSWTTVVSDQDREKVAEQMRRRFSGESDSAHYVYRGRRKDGTIIDAEVLGNTTRLNGRLAVVGTCVDITERRKREEDLYKSEERFRNAFECTSVPMVLTDLGHRFLRFNAAFESMFGYSREELLRLSMPQITHPDDLAESLARREGLKSRDVDHFQMEKRYLHKDGRLIWGLVNVSLIRDAQGQPQQYIGQVQDITERKSAEERLRQAQKMEAIGQLAGGVAHDFNNLLTVINGYSELLLHGLPPSEAHRSMVEQIYKAGERAAMLTRQLLAFSRKQVIEPKLLDLNAVIADAEKMLKRLIGEDVLLASAPAAKLPLVKADPGQVEQVILNLCVNARDAMPKGGRLTIETARVELGEEYARTHPEVKPGRYVMLAVSDTGCGMDAETRARIFEPFFTTKGVGQGTGLGLSTVFGIVKQAGGHVWVYSELGRGTTFKVYLPAIEAAESSVAASAPVTAKGGTETILLLEDDTTVRSFARLSLQGRGYTVLDAGEPKEALALAESHPGSIHVLITDVVMPGMGGREVAERLADLRPGLKVLFVSGYTNDAVVRHGVLQSEVAFLQKPFSGAALAAKVRAVLDGRTSTLRPPRT